MNVPRISTDIPTIVKFSGQADVIAEIPQRIRLSAFQCDDTRYLPALQQLQRRSPTRYFISHRQRETVSYVEIAVPSLRLVIQAVLRHAGRITRRSIDRVCVSVSRQQVQPVRKVMRQRDLP